MATESNRKDGTVGLVWNQYNADGFLIGAEKNYTNDDVKGSTKGLDNKDIKLGAFDAIYSGTATDITSLDVNGGSVTGTVVAGANGTIVARVLLNGKTEAFATSTINVKVPK